MPICDLYNAVRDVSLGCYVLQINLVCREVIAHVVMCIFLTLILYTLLYGVTSVCPLLAPTIRTYSVIYFEVGNYKIKHQNQFNWDTENSHSRLV